MGKKNMQRETLSKREKTLLTKYRGELKKLALEETEIFKKRGLKEIEERHDELIDQIDFVVNRLNEKLLDLKKADYLDLNSVGFTDIYTGLNFLYLNKEIVKNELGDFDHMVTTMVTELRAKVIEGEFEVVSKRTADILENEDNRLLRQCIREVVKATVPLAEEIKNELLDTCDYYIESVDLEYINEILNLKKFHESLIKQNVERLEVKVSDKPFELEIVEGLILKTEKSFKFMTSTSHTLTKKDLVHLQREINNYIIKCSEDTDVDLDYIINEYMSNKEKKELEHLTEYDINKNKDLSWQDLNNLALKNNFVLDRCKGSHATFKNGNRSVTIPQGHTIGKGLQNSILKIIYS